MDSLPGTEWIVIAFAVSVALCLLVLWYFVSRQEYVDPETRLSDFVNSVTDSEDDLSGYTLISTECRGTNVYATYVNALGNLKDVLYIKGSSNCH